MKKFAFAFFRTIFPYVKKVREEIGAPSQIAIFRMNNFSSERTTFLLEKVEEEVIVVIVIPPGTTDRLQLLDESTTLKMTS